MREIERNHLQSLQDFDHWKIAGVLCCFDQPAARFGSKRLRASPQQGVQWVRAMPTPTHPIATGKKRVSLTTYNTLLNQPANPLRLRIRQRTCLPSRYQTGAIVSTANRKSAARLYWTARLSQSRQKNVLRRRARADIALPAGCRHFRRGQTRVTQVRGNPREIVS